MSCNRYLRLFCYYNEEVENRDCCGGGKTGHKYLNGVAVFSGSKLVAMLERPFHVSDLGGVVTIRDANELEFTFRASQTKYSHEQLIEFLNNCNSFYESQWGTITGNIQDQIDLWAELQERNNICGFQSVDTLPEDPDECIIYLHDGKYWAWDGSQFVDVTPDSGVMSVTGDNVDNTDPANPVVNTVNLYNSNGVLTSNRVVDLDGKNMIFQTYAGGEFKVISLTDLNFVVAKDLLFVDIAGESFKKLKIDENGIAINPDGAFINDFAIKFLRSKDLSGNLIFDYIQFTDIQNVPTFILASEKGAANGVAPLGSDQLIPTQYLPPIAISEVIQAAETTIAAFAANSGSYTFETGDVILIDDSGNVQHYLYKGGTKTDVNEYSPISATQIDWSNVLNKPTDLQDNLFTKDLTLATARTQTLDGVKLLFDIINGGEFALNANTGIFTFTNTGPTSTQQLQSNGNIFRLKCINNTTFHEAYIGIKLAGSGRPAIEIKPNLENFNSGACKYGKRVNGFDFEWGDIEIPEYADDNAADADSDLVSGAPYSVTGDRTVYRKP